MRQTRTLYITINDARPAGLAQLMNALALPDGAAQAAPEWISIPYGDVPYDRDGTRGIQRMNLAVAQELIRLCAEAASSDPRGAAGLPFYIGHPDYVLAGKEAQAAWLQNQPEAVGWIREFRATSNSLDLRVEWTEAGAKLVGSRAYKFFSPFFLSAKTGTENGKTIFEPRYIVSAGLTNTPNWPMPPMVNAALADGGGKGSGMNLLQRLIALLGDESITDDDGAVTAVVRLIEAAKKMKASVEARWAAEDAARLALPNAADPFVLVEGYLAHSDALLAQADAATRRSAELEAQLNAAREAHARDIVGAAVARGAVLQEHAETRVSDMVNAGEGFAARAKEVGALPPLMKTASDAPDVAARGRGAADRRAQIHEAVNAALPKFGGDYDKAFASVVHAMPGLFDEPKQAQ